METAALRILLLPAACVLFPGRIEASPVSTEVKAGGVRIEEMGGVYRIPVKAKDVLFSVGEESSKLRERARSVRYRLEGVDPGWMYGPGEMSVTAVFFDKAGDHLEQKQWLVHGKSSGWNKTAEDSTFTHRRETLVVPPKADSICVFISSAGPPTAVGIYVIEDMSVSRAVEGSAPEIVLESSAFLRTGDENASNSEWVKDGTHASMATIIPLGETGSFSNAFCIVDDDPSSHAEWHYNKTKAPKVTPGERLIIEWNELYNCGNADKFYAAYPVPAPGDYEFKVQELNAMGLPSGPENILKMRVPQPYWRTGWFLIGAFVIGGGVCVIAINYLMRMKMRRHLQKVEQEHMLERERLRIARNIHDDLGARLTHISLISAHAAEDELPKSASENFKKITTMARDLVAALYETVWTIDPENDELESLVTFLGQYIQNVCSAGGIRCRFDTDEIPRGHPVASEIRHNLRLVIKEAMHNVVRHAEASEVKVRMRFEHKRLSICIEDNGRGLVTKGALAPDSLGKAQNGIGNMKKRMESIKGEFKIEGGEGKGTRVLLEVAIPPLRE